MCTFHSQKVCRNEGHVSKNNTLFSKSLGRISVITSPISVQMLLYPIMCLYGNKWIRCYLIPSEPVRMDIMKHSHVLHNPSQWLGDSLREAFLWRGWDAAVRECLGAPDSAGLCWSTMHRMQKQALQRPTYFSSAFDQRGRAASPHPRSLCWDPEAVLILNNALCLLLLHTCIMCLHYVSGRAVSVLLLIF